MEGGGPSRRVGCRGGPRGRPGKVAAPLALLVALAAWGRVAATDCTAAVEAMAGPGAPTPWLSLAAARGVLARLRPAAGTAGTAEDWAAAWASAERALGEAACGGVDNLTTTPAAAASPPSDCQRLPVDGASRLDLQPSDVVYDPGTGGWLLASGAAAVYALPLQGGALAPLAAFEGLSGKRDIEALAVDGRLVFAVDEAKDEARLLVADRGALPPTVREVWLEGSSKAEGAAFSFERELLYVGSEDGSVRAYRVPGTGELRDGASLRPEGELNRKMLTAGVEHAPKVGGMTVWNDKLYVLHDNARVVRRWDLETGELLGEIPLPGDTREWEGLAMVRDPGGTYLVLALDTPGEVWRFKVTEEGDAFSLPACAYALAFD